MASEFLKVRSLLTSSQRRSAGVLVGLMSIGMVLETIGIGLVIPTLVLMTEQDLAARYPRLQPLLYSLDNPSPVHLIQMAMLGLVGIYLIKNLFLAFLAWRQTRFAYGVQVQLSQRLFTTYLRQPYTFHLQRNSAQLIRNVTGEVAMFTEAIMSTMLVLTESLALLGIATLLLLVEPLGALIVVLVLGGAAWIFYRGTRSRIARWGVARQHHDGMRLQHLQQGLGGAKDVKLLGRERDFLEQYDLHNSKSARVGQFQAMVQQLPRLWLELLAVVGLTTLVLTMLTSRRDLASIVPTLGLFAAAAFRLMPSVNRILAGIQTLRYNRPVISTLYAEIQLAPDESPIPRLNHDEPGSRLVFQTEIRATDIGYTYFNAPAPALDRLSLSISKGESIGLIGPSGSGKSTLVDIILGLLTPDAGNITVDGQNIQQCLRRWQDKIGYVPQSIYLTDDTLKRNVAFGLPVELIDDAAVRQAIKSSQLEDLVASLPEGLDTVVGERGIRLSGGQRQRIGIARALYHDPAVLVLDEATSALDTATERGVMEAVKALHGSKTILIVAHRLSTVAHCDRIYRLEQGGVVEEGPPADLLRVPRAV